MNNYKNSKIEKFFNTNFVKDAVKLLVMKNPDGSYDLFDKYIITPKDNKYILLSRFSYETKEFVSLKNAVAYCVFSVKNKINESNRIYELDQNLASANFNIALLNSLITKSKSDKVLIYCDKLSEEQDKKNKLFTAINFYRRQANKYQLSTFKTSAKFIY